VNDSPTPSAQTRRHPSLSPSNDHQQSERSKPTLHKSVNVAPPVVRRENPSRVLNEAEGRDLALESRNTLERVRTTRSQTRLSSLKPDSLSIPRELQRNTRSSLTDNELSKARKADSHRESSSELTTETATTVSRTSSKFPTCVEIDNCPNRLYMSENRSRLELSPQLLLAFLVQESHPD
jgi:hypothetical protein